MPRSKFTPARRSAILAAVKAGNYATVACRAAGIQEKTYYRWLQHGRDALAVEEEGGRTLTSAEKAYAAFVQEIDQADAQAEAKALSRLERFGDDSADWREVMAMMSRRWAPRWGQASSGTLVVETGAEGESKGLEVKLSFTPPAVVEREEAA